MHKLLLSQGATVDEAVRLLDANGNGFLPVVDAENKLLGIITDGDLRKALIRHQWTLDGIINTHPEVAGVSEPRVSIQQRLRSLKRRHMPVVDEQGRFVDVVVLDDFVSKSNDYTVVIMAGGLGSRLGELTLHTPKPMLPVNGKPILLRIVETFQSFGFSSFLFCLNYKAEVIQQYFGDGSKFGVSIEHVVEEKRLGTAGALGLIKPDQLSKPFIVTNGDILTSLNYEDFFDFHLKTKATATLCVKQYSMQLPYANVISDADGNLVALEEKPSIPFYVNAGIYAFQPTVLDFVAHNQYLDMPSLLVSLRQADCLVKTFRMDDYWVDIGQPQDYSRLK